MPDKLSSAEAPSLRALPLENIGDGLAVKLLTPRQRQELLSLSTRVVVAPRGTVYREHAPAAAVYICGEGSLKSFRELPSGKRRVMGFLFAEDLFGLAERGRYVNSVQALTRSICYRIPREPLTAILRRDAELEFQFLCKVVQELRKQQFHAIVMGRRSASGRIAMFLKMLEDHLAHAGHSAIPLPMTRADIAGYLGLSAEAVSRGGKKLIEAGVVAFSGANAVRVLDRKRLDAIAADF